MVEDKEQPKRGIEAEFNPNAYELNRALLLGKVSTDFMLMSGLLKREKKNGMNFSFQGMSQTSYWVNPHVLFGIYLVRKSLIADICEMGKPQMAKDILKHIEETYG